MIVRQHAGELAAEFFATTVLVWIGLSAQAAALAAGTPGVIPWAWGAALALAIYISAPVSGGHVNPAVTWPPSSAAGPWRR